MSRPLAVRSAAAARRIAIAASLFAGALASAGCAHVRAYEREYLQDPIMSLADEAKESKDNLHWIEAREGSTGGAGAAGGGCACN